MSEASNPRLYEQVAATIAEKIQSGELPNGSRLPSERELTQAFGVSRTSIREALLILQSSGLISMREKARAKITALNSSSFFNQLSSSAQMLLSQPNGMADFQEARTLFECGLVRHIARHASPKDIDRLGLALLRNRQAIGDADEFVRTDLEFHNILADIPRNSIFVALNNALSQWLMDQRTVSIQAPIRDVQAEAFAGHQRVYEQIAARNPEGAEIAMMEHLKTVSDAYWQATHGQQKEMPFNPDEVSETRARRAKV